MAGSTTGTVPDTLFSRVYRPNGAQALWRREAIAVESQLLSCGPADGQINVGKYSTRRLSEIIKNLSQSVPVYPSVPEMKYTSSLIIPGVASYQHD